jgi:hypothetical protein
LKLKEKVPSGVNAPTVLTHRKMPPASTGDGIYVQNVVDTHPGNLLSVFRPLGTYFTGRDKVPGSANIIVSPYSASK